MTTKQLVLPETIASPQDLMQVTAEVRLYAKWYSHEAILRRVSRKTGTPAPTLSRSAHHVINVWHVISPINTRSLAALISTLEGYAKKAEVLTITLAAPVTGSIKAELVAWCRTNISPQIFVSFQFNSTLMGGMVVRYGSRVFDWSFRRQILANSAQFPEVLRRV